MSAPSIRRRLLGGLFVAMTLAWGLTARWSHRAAIHEMQEVWDAQLAQVARFALAQSHGLVAAPPVPQVAGTDAREDHPYGAKVNVQVWGAGDVLLFRSSPETPTAPLSPRRRGYSDVVIAGAAWRVFGAVDEGRGLAVLAGQRGDVQAEIADAVTANLLRPVIFVLPLLGALLWFGVGWGTASLRRVAEELRAREARRLDPLELAGVPVEVLPLVAALNTLLADLARALDAERRFTADAAHELRTPLAVASTWVGLAASAPDAAERDRALVAAKNGLGRLNRLVAQMLTLAGIEAEHSTDGVAPVALRALAEDVVAELAPSVGPDGPELSVLGAGGMVSGRRDLLFVLVRNLVDNALRHAVGGTEIAVEVGGGTRGDPLWVAVHDDGPGIPLVERPFVFERFGRRRGAGTDGHGLGLAIVKRVADLHGASLSVEDGRDGRGLTMRVVFPTGPQRAG